MTNIVDELIKAKIAKNAFHAANMLNVLHCANLQNDEDRIARCLLYHQWKQAGETKAAARANAIEGKPAPEQLIPAVGYSCSYCGYHPGNRADWCDAGCGSDYNKMIKVDVAPIPEEK